MRPQQIDYRRPGSGLFVGESTAAEDLPALLGEKFVKQPGFAHARFPDDAYDPPAPALDLIEQVPQLRELGVARNEAARTMDSGGAGEERTGLAPISS